MKTKTVSKKLAVKRNMIKQLSTADLKKVVGGSRACGSTY